ncbi:coiled-coil domain-containing protein 97 [Brevipalpus obovatus]|uniref:coiled-coil domain-containing protein 97 n=1 Tax=Brevipalpus obovatus TaxID=246614 RepID=UPI003D9E174C
MIADEDSAVIDDIFKSIVDHSDAYIREQHRDSPDLCENEKIDILSNLFKTNQLSFLYRYHKYLSSNQLEFIRNGSNNDEINYFVDKVLENQGKDKSKVGRRRFAALQKLILEGEYFNDHNMRQRNPYLYEQMVGKYLTEEERKTVDSQDRGIDELSRPLSSFFLRQLDKNRVEMLRLHQMNEFESERINESDDGDDDEDQSCDDAEEEIGEDLESETTSNPNEGIKISDQDKEKLRDEFRNMMYEQFLNGKDEFDYKSVDDNEEYDPLEMIGRDAEDSYFDSEEPS